MSIARSSSTPNGAKNGVVWGPKEYWYTQPCWQPQRTVLLKAAGKFSAIASPAEKATNMPSAFATSPKPEIASKNSTRLGWAVVI